MATVSIPLKFKVPRYQFVSIMGARWLMALVMASTHAGNWDVPLFFSNPSEIQDLGTIGVFGLFSS
jgi:hypothetical protein